MSLVRQPQALLCFRKPIVPLSVDIKHRLSQSKSQTSTTQSPESAMEDSHSLHDVSDFLNDFGSLFDSDSVHSTASRSTDLLSDDDDAPPPYTRDISSLSDPHTPFPGCVQPPASYTQAHGHVSFGEESRPLSWTAITILQSTLASSTLASVLPTVELCLFTCKPEEEGGRAHHCSFGSPHLLGFGWRDWETGNTRFFSPKLERIKGRYGYTAKLNRVCELPLWPKDDRLEPVYPSGSPKLHLQKRIHIMLRTPIATVTTRQARKFEAVVREMHDSYGKPKGVIPGCNYHEWAKMAVLVGMQEGILPKSTKEFVEDLFKWLLAVGSTG